MDTELRREIMYELRYYGESTETEHLILESLLRLPADVRAFALERCAFLSTDNIRGSYLSAEYVSGLLAGTREWLVLLHLDGLKPESAESYVAHEIAHIWLGHGTFELANSTAEIDAAAQVRAWGFKGGGTRPSWLPTTGGR